jgi:hypothetical protein
MHRPRSCPLCGPHLLVLLCTYRLCGHHFRASVTQERDPGLPERTDCRDRHHRDSDDWSLWGVGSSQQFGNVQVLCPHRHLSHRRTLAFVRRRKAHMHFLTENRDHHEGVDGCSGRHLQLQSIVVTSLDHPDRRCLPPPDQGGY